MSIPQDLFNNVNDDLDLLKSNKGEVIPRKGTAHCFFQLQGRVRS